MEKTLKRIYIKKNGYDLGKVIVQDQNYSVCEILGLNDKAYAKVICSSELFKKEYELLSHLQRIEEQHHFNAMPEFTSRQKEVSTEFHRISYLNKAFFKENKFYPDQLITDENGVFAGYTIKGSRCEAIETVLNNISGTTKADRILKKIKVVGSMIKRITEIKYALNCSFTPLAFSDFVLSEDNLVQFIGYEKIIFLSKGESNLNFSDSKVSDTLYFDNIIKKAFSIIFSIDECDIYDSKKRLNFTKEGFVAPKFIRQEFNMVWNLIPSVVRELFCILLSSASNSDKIKAFDDLGQILLGIDDNALIKLNDKRRKNVSETLLCTFKSLLRFNWICLLIILSSEVEYENPMCHIFPTALIILTMLSIMTYYHVIKRVISFLILASSTIYLYIQHPSLWNVWIEISNAFVLDGFLIFEAILLCISFLFAIIQTINRNITLLHLYKEGN